MIRSIFSRATAAAGLLLVSSGCITVSPPTLGMGAKQPQNIQNVAFEAPEEEIPEVKDPIALKLKYAKVMEEVGQTVEARKQYIAVSEEQPNNVPAILGLARIEQATGRYTEAEQAIRRALKIKPKSPEANFELAQFYAAQQQWQMSIEPYTTAMLGAPDNTEYRYSLAVALVHTGDVDSALPHFIRTVGDAEAHYNVGLILKSDGHLEEAERHFLMAVTKKPELEAARNWLVHLRELRNGVAQNSPKKVTPQPAHILPVTLSVPVVEPARTPSTHSAPAEAQGEFMQPRVSQNAVPQRRVAGL